LDHSDPDPAREKMISNPVPDPNNSHNPSGSDSKNPDPEQHWLTRDCYDELNWRV